MRLSGSKNRFWEFAWDFNCVLRERRIRKQQGLDLFPGKVVGFHAAAELKVPHMGWKRIAKAQDSPFPKAFRRATMFIRPLVYVAPQDPTIVATTTDYGQSFVSSIATERLFACQFHPEKSQELGLRISPILGGSLTTIDN